MSLSISPWSFIQAVVCVNSLFSSLLSGIPWSGCTTGGLPIHLQKNIWVVSSFLVITNKTVGLAVPNQIWATVIGFQVTLLALPVPMELLVKHQPALPQGHFLQDCTCTEQMRARPCRGRSQVGLEPQQEAEPPS